MALNMGGSPLVTDIAHQLDKGHRVIVMVDGMPASGLEIISIEQGRGQDGLLTLECPDGITWRTTTDRLVAARYEQRREVADEADPLEPFKAVRDPRDGSAIELLAGFRKGR
jgi:hypothetical protein